MTVALVTAGNRGIGLEICRELADRDVEVILTSRDEGRARRAAERLWEEGMDSVHPRLLDVTSSADAARLRDLVAGEFGRLDVLVHAMPDADAAQRISAAFAQLLERSGGRAVVVSADDDPAALVTALLAG